MHGVIDNLQEQKISCYGIYCSLVGNNALTVKNKITLHKYYYIIVWKWRTLLVGNVVIFVPFMLTNIFPINIRILKEWNSLAGYSYTLHRH